MYTRVAIKRKEDTRIMFLKSDKWGPQDTCLQKMGAYPQQDSHPNTRRATLPWLTLQHWSPTGPFNLGNTKTRPPRKNRASSVSLGSSLMPSKFILEVKKEPLQYFYGDLKSTLEIRTQAKQGAACRWGVKISIGHMDRHRWGHRNRNANHTWF